jgi:LuxR family maltose regulon positive regulatory protein
MTPGTPILLTRLALPPVGPHLLPRPALLARAGGPQAGTRLLLLSAPAGFGKTSLLTVWGHALIASGTRVAWFGLEPGDNDPARFITALVAAVARALDGLADLQPVLDRCAGAADPTEVVAALLNTLAASPHPLAVVLDDYHTITSPEIHGLVTFLVAHLPPAVTLAVGTRSDPPLQLARLRASHAFIELRAADLRFTAAEIDAMLGATLGRPLAPDERVVIDAWAEGWPAGLQLLALQLARRDVTASPEGFADAMRAATGESRGIVEYLAEEVYAGLEPELQQFLLDTAILDQLSPELCDAVTERDNSDVLLEQLTRANLFLIPLDPSGRWVRYHHLFAEFLRARLRREQPARAAALALRASAWYASHGDTRAALEHALAAEAYDEAATLLARSADALWLRGETETLRAALDRFPQPLAPRWPRLALARAWLALHTGRLAEAEALADAVAAGLAPSLSSAADLPTLQGMVDVIRAVVLANEGQPAAAVEHAAHALRRLPDDQLLWRTVATVALGAAATLSGDVRWAGASFEAATALASEAGSVPLRLIALRNLALMQQVQGELRAAGASYRALDALVARHGGATAYSALQAQAEQALLRYERDDLAPARAGAEAALAGGRQQRNTLIMLQGHLALAQVLPALGGAAEALAHAREATQLAEEHGIAHLVLPARAQQARLERLAGDADVAHAWAVAASVRLDDGADLVPPAYPGPWEPAVLAEHWLAAGRPADALALTERLLGVVAPLGRLGRIVELHVLQARAHAALGQDETARQALERALVLGEPEGYVRSFVDGGEVVAALLEAHSAQHTAQHESLQRYVERLRAACSAGNAGAAVLGSNASMLERFPEPLSVREREILALVARGASNQAIAEALVIAPSTVKVHLHHILGKLEARSRTEAVARARELGLL